MNQAFESYVKNYDMNDKDINYKYHHSYRVMENAKMIAKDMPKEDQVLAEIIGLYHDIGRFYQDKKYDSFYDMATFDHGDYGAKIIVEENIINQIPIDKKYHKIIEKAIKNHNKYEIEQGLTEKELLHAKIIRDADKLDILTAKSKGITLKGEKDKKEENFNVRDSIKEDFYNKKQIKMTKENTGNKTEVEIMLVYLAFIFDLNFKKSLEYLLENKILENLYNNLNKKENYKEYFDYINNYIKERIKC